MILGTFADHLPVSIGARIRAVFFFYGVISLAAFVTIYESPQFYDSSDLEWVYLILFPFSVICCLIMTLRPKVGSGSIFLLPLFIIAVIRILDIWWNYFEGDLSLEIATRYSVGWSFLLISIAYVDLLESRIYHRMVAYIEQEAD